MLYVISILAIIVFGSMAYAARKGAPWVPTWKNDIERAKKLFNLQPGEKVYELGCGDGRVIIAFGKSEKVKAIGIELSLLQYLVARLRKFLSKAENVEIRFGNAMKANLSYADAVYMFLMPPVYEKIRPKFEAELKPGARVVSYVWPIPGWEPVQVDEQEGKSALYLYQR